MRDRVNNHNMTSYHVVIGEQLMFLTDVQALPCDVIKIFARANIIGLFRIRVDQNFLDLYYNNFMSRILK